MSDYAHPEVLVTTAWAEDHLNDPAVRILEVDYDPSSAYELGHIPGAALIDWKKDINHATRRDILPREQFERLMGRLGATPDTTLILYGDMRNWFAAFAFWTFKIYGHEDVRMLMGPRDQWAQMGHEWSTDTPAVADSGYPPVVANDDLLATREAVQRAIDDPAQLVLDVRAEGEYAGELFWPSGATNDVGRTGHVPGARRDGHDSERG